MIVITDIYYFTKITLFYDIAERFRIIKTLDDYLKKWHEYRGLSDATMTEYMMLNICVQSGMWVMLHHFCLASYALSHMELYLIHRSTHLSMRLLVNLRVKHYIHLIKI